MALLEYVRGSRLRITGGYGINQQLSAHRRYVVRFGGLSLARGCGSLRTSSLRCGIWEEAHSPRIDNMKRVGEGDVVRLLTGPTERRDAEGQSLVRRLGIH